MNTKLSALFSGIAAAHYLALLVPGPDFVLLVKSAMLHRRRHAMGIVTGITVSNLLYVTLSLAGIAALLAVSPFATGLLSLAGGTYLCFLGLSPLLAERRSRQCGSEVESESGGESDKKSLSSFGAEFRIGLGASILNPKLPLFYLGLFSLLVREGVSTAFRIAMGVWMITVVFLWDALLVCVITTPAVRLRLAAGSKWISRVTGIVLFILGLNVLLSFFQ